MSVSKDFLNNFPQPCNIQDELNQLALDLHLGEGEDLFEEANPDEENALDNLLGYLAGLRQLRDQLAPGGQFDRILQDLDPAEEAEAEAAPAPDQAATLEENQIPVPPPSPASGSNLRRRSSFFIQNPSSETPARPTAGLRRSYSF